VVAAPDSKASEVMPLKTDHPLFAVRGGRDAQCRQRLQSGEGEALHRQVTRDGKAYQAVLTPISFRAGRW